MIGDKNYFGRDFEQQLTKLGIRLLRPTRKGEAERPGSHLFKPLRQVIKSVNETFKGQLDLERDRGRTPGGMAVPAAHPGSHRRHLARRPCRPDDETRARRLRPLNPLELII
ncbi:hypothetical protein ACIHCV_36610 [Streptomyces sp. NPDC051956]|uniref:hypothetical protein n=1 Tax=Streptomyces sp. NPDC051956 TaxID=3365677 RepID=UPI0037CE0320